MANATATNFHVPLPPKLYAALRKTAEREGRPATQLAREAIARFILMQRRREIEGELRAYVAATAGSLDDLDPDIEAASLEVLRPPRRRRR